MNAMCKTVPIYMAIGDDARAKEIVENIHEMINNEPRIYFEYSISIPYELAIYYKSINNLSENQKYLNISFNEYNRIENLLGKEDRIFFKEKLIHNKINFEARNI